MDYSRFIFILKGDLGYFHKFLLLHKNEIENLQENNNSKVVNRMK